MAVDDVIELVWKDNRITPIDHYSLQDNRGSGARSESGNSRFTTKNISRGIEARRAVGSRSKKRSFQNPEEEHVGFVNVRASFGGVSKVEKALSSFSCAPLNETNIASASKISTKRKRKQLERNLCDKKLPRKFNVKLKMLHALVPNCKQRVGTTSMLNQVIGHIKSLKRDMQMMKNLNYMQQTPSFALTALPSVPVIGGCLNANPQLASVATGYPLNLALSPSFFPPADAQPPIHSCSPAIPTPIASFHSPFQFFSSTPYIVGIPAPPVLFHHPPIDLPSNLLFPNSSFPRGIPNPPVQFQQSPADLPSDLFFPASLLSGSHPGWKIN